MQTTVKSFALYALSTALLASGAALNCRPIQDSVVNVRHLEHLAEPISFGGDTVEIVHVYSNYPDYRWYRAADSGVEGVACVDDAARAAVLYLRHHDLTQDQKSLKHAQRLLEFVLKMQAEDGQFYNFIFDDHSVNTDGKTSFKSFGWWAARGLWCLGTGYRIFRERDPRFAELLHAALLRSFPRVRALVTNAGKTDDRSGYRIPLWLPYDSGADVTSEMTLGLVEWYSVEPDTSVGSAIVKLLEGVMLMQDGTATEYPYGLHRSWETMWHMWGNSQTQALASAGKILPDTTMIASAEREANGFYSRLLVDGFMKEFDVAKSDPPVRYEQIAYAVRPMAVGLIRLYEATGNHKYLVMAGLAGSWLFGNNVLGKPVYDIGTGRCYDGIRDSVTLNLNSGAESTIEALYTLVEIEHYPEALRYVQCTRISQQTSSRYHTALFRNPAGDEATVGVDLASGELVVLTGEESRKFQKELQQ